MKHIEVSLETIKWQINVQRENVIHIKQSVQMGTIASEASVNQIHERSYCRNSEYRSISHQILAIKLRMNMK